MMNPEKKDNLKTRCYDAHRNQSGAMALMALASILIIVMVGMTLYDVAELGVEKTHIQTATDTSAYSQATIEARSMNMIAFTNAGKRMTIGTVNTYLSMNQWLLWLSQLARFAEVLAWIARFVPPLSAIAEQVRQAASAIRSMQSSEERVRDTVATKSSKRYFRYWSTCSWGRPCRKSVYYDNASLIRPRSMSQFWEWWAPSTSFNYPLTPPEARPCGSRPGLSFYTGSASFNSPLGCANGDIYNWNSAPLMDDFYGRDLLGYDNYQRYMEALSPFWSWTEGAKTGITNSAPVTISYPMPNFEDGAEHDKKLPINRGTWDDTCDYVENNDRGWTSPIGVDYVLKNLVSGVGGGALGGSLAGAIGEVLALVIMGQATLHSNPLADTVITPRSWGNFCSDVLSDLFAGANSGGGLGSSYGFGGGSSYVSGFKEYGEPYLLNEYNGDRAQWMMDSSNLMFGFRPNANRFNEGRDKFFVSGEVQYPGPDAGGTWAMSRAEIAFQGGEPNVWSPEWTARMRPVALPGEWDDLNDFELSDAFYQIADTLAVTTTYAHLNNDDLITHPHGGAVPDLAQEIMAITAAVEGMNDESMEGLAR